MTNLVRVFVSTYNLWMDKKRKLDKALAPDDLNADHLLYAYAAISVHICALFSHMILHGYVPNDFVSAHCRTTH